MNTGARYEEVSIPDDDSISPISRDPPDTDQVRNPVISQIARSLGSTSIRHRSDTFASDRCLINVGPRLFAICDVKMYAIMCSNQTGIGPMRRAFSDIRNWFKINRFPIIRIVFSDTEIQHLSPIWRSIWDTPIYIYRANGCHGKCPDTD